MRLCQNLPTDQVNITFQGVFVTSSTCTVNPKITGSFHMSPSEKGQFDSYCIFELSLAEIVNEKLRVKKDAKFIW